MTELVSNDNVCPTENIMSYSYKPYLDKDESQTDVNRSSIRHLRVVWCLIKVDLGNALHILRDSVVGII